MAPELIEGKVDPTREPTRLPDAPTEFEITFGPADVPGKYPAPSVKLLSVTMLTAVVAVPLTVIPDRAVIAPLILIAYPVAELPVSSTAFPVRATVELSAVVDPLAVPNKVKLPVVLMI